MEKEKFLLDLDSIIQESETLNTMKSVKNHNIFILAAQLLKDYDNENEFTPYIRQECNKSTVGTNNTLTELLKRAYKYYAEK